MNTVIQQSPTRLKPVIVVLRWLAFLPAAILAAVVAQYLTNILNTFSMYYVYVRPGSLLGKVWILFIGNVVFGATLVFIGTFIAPTHKRVVAPVLAGLLLIGTGAVVVLALQSKQYWNIFATVASNIGAIGMAISINKGKTPIQRHTHSTVDPDDNETSLGSEPRPPLHKSLMEKAQDAPVAFRILVDVIQRQLEQTYPQVMRLSRWSAFQMAGTIAGCVALAVRLHFEVSEEQRTPLELAMRDVLRKKFPDSEEMYGDCYRFVTESLKDIPRSERGKYLFVLLGMWTLAVVSEGEEIEQQDQIVGRIAEAYQNETAGFWRDDVVGE